MSAEPGPTLSGENHFEKLREALGRVHEDSRRAEAEVRQWVDRYEKAKRAVKAAKAVLAPPEKPREERTAEPAQERPAPVERIGEPAARTQSAPIELAAESVSHTQAAPIEPTRPEPVTTGQAPIPARTVPPPLPPPPAPPAPVSAPEAASFCSACGRELRPGARFCSGCGSKTAARPDACPDCGRPVGPTARFCPGCGTPIGAAPPAGRSAGAPATHEPALRTAATEPERVAPPAASTGPRDWDLAAPPPPPPTGDTYTSGDAGGGAPYEEPRGSTAAHVGMNAAAPPTGTPWSFRARTTELAQRLLAGASQVGTGRIDQNVLRRVVRATLLDTAVFRETAEDQSLQLEAWQVALVVILASSLGMQILSLQLFTGPQILLIVTTTVVQIIAWLARVWIIRLAAGAWANRKLEFNALFRSLAYAQAPVALAPIPMVGPLLALWALVTTTAAVQDLTACDTTTAVVLTVIGAVGVAAAIWLTGPLMRMFF